METMAQAAVALGVLALLGGALFWLRKGGIAAWPTPARAGRRMQSLERLPLSPQHSLHLVRVGERTLVVATSPGGCTLLDSDPPGATREGGPR